MPTAKQGPLFFHFPFSFLFNFLLFNFAAARIINYSLNWDKGRGSTLIHKSILYGHQSGCECKYLCRFRLFRINWLPPGWAADGEGLSHKVSLGPAWGPTAPSLPPSGLRPPPLRSFTRWAPNTGMMGVGVSKEAGWIRAQKDCLKKEGDTQKDESPPNKPSPAQALQRHLYVIRNA